MAEKQGGSSEAVDHVDLVLEQVMNSLLVLRDETLDEIVSGAFSELGRDVVDYSFDLGGDSTEVIEVGERWMPLSEAKDALKQEILELARNIVDPQDLPPRSDPRVDTTYRGIKAQLDLSLIHI